MFKIVRCLLLKCLLFIICLSINSRLLGQDAFYKDYNIREIRIYFKEANWRYILDSMFINYGEEQRLEGSVLIGGKKFERAGIRYKGFSSYNSKAIKNPFNIDLDYVYNNQNYEGYKKLKLSNVINDPSFVREVLSYQIARQYMPVSQANFAMLYVNDSLMGLYSNVEAVDKNFVEKHFGYADNSFIKGSPYKLEYPFGQNSNLAYTHGADSSGYIPYYKLESEYGWNDLFKFIYILNNQPDSLENVLNTDRCLWMHAFNYALLNLDSYIGYAQNYYLYEDNTGRFNPILWDLNMSFGSFRNTDGISLSLSIAKLKKLDPLQYESAISLSPRPLMKNLFQYSVYKKTYIAHLRTIMNENIRNNKYYEQAEVWRAKIDSFVQLDSNKFYSYDYFLKNIDVAVGSGANQFPGLKDLMDARLTYLDTYTGFTGEPIISDVSYQPQLPDINDEVKFVVKVKKANKVLLAYRYKKDNQFSKTEMYDDGLHNDALADDSVYGTTIICSRNIIQYYIYAENDSAATLLPERAEFEFYTIQPRIRRGILVINEINSNEGWIELYNNTEENLNLKGLYLSDDIKNISKWAFPDTLIKPESYLIIFTGATKEQSGLNSGLILQDRGGKLILAYDETNIIDSVIFDKQIEQKSYGRYPNGNGNFAYMLPTFGYYNLIPSLSITVNKNDLDFILYPNPAFDRLYVEIAAENTTVSINIYNATGLRVLSEEHKCFTPVFIKEYDLEYYKSGLYYLRLSNGGEEISKKFIIY